MSKPRPLCLRRTRSVPHLLLCAAWSAFASGPLAAQATGGVAGTVTDARNGTTVSGIVVEVQGLRSVTVTTPDGRYRLEGLAAGSHTLRFTWFGYRSVERTVDVRAGGTVTLDVPMDPEPMALGEIVVTTASRQPERVLESPAAVTPVDPVKIRGLAQTGQTPLLIADIPGVRVIQSGVNSFSVTTRAFNTLLNRRLLVLVDGRDVSTPMAGAQEWPGISISEPATRVELVQGPGSALYGANAYSGVLNILTPSARQTQGTRLTVGGGGLSALSVDGRHAGLSSDLRWGYRVSGSWDQVVSWDRSRTDLGDFASEYADAVDGPLGGSPPAPGFEVVPLAGQTKSTSFGIPGPATGDRDPLTVARGSARVERYFDDGGVLTLEGGYTRMENQVAATGASRAQVVSAEVPWARVAFGSDRVNVMAYYQKRTADQTDLSTGTPFADASSRAHVEAQINRTLGDGRGHLVLGASARSERVDSKGTILAPRFDGRTDEYYALFGQLDWEVGGGLKLIAAGRLDDSSLYDSEVSPKLGLLWAPTENHALRLTYGTAYLTPSAGARFVEFPLGPPLDLSALEAGLRASPLGPALAGVPDGTLLTNSAAVSALAIGNQNLGAESVTSWEAGYKGQIGSLFVAAAGHRSHFDDFATGLLPGVHPDYAPWTAPDAVPEIARGPLEDAVRQALPGVTRLAGGTTAMVFASTVAGQATEIGADLSVSARVGESITLDGSYSWISVDFEEGTYLGGDSVPTNTPTHAGTVSATWASPGGSTVRASLNLVNAYHFTEGVWDGDVPGRQSVDLLVSHPVAEGIRAGLSVTNVFDQRRFQYFGGSLVGRRLFASLTWEP